MILVDTNVLIEVLRDNAAISERLAAETGPVFMSVLNRVELEGGVHRPGTDPAPRRAALDLLLATIPVLDFDNACASVYGRLAEAIGYSRANLIDRMIAAQAIAGDLKLVTLDRTDFADIPDLKLEVW